MTAACDREFHIDCHAHLHPCFNVESWLSHAITNLLPKDNQEGNVVPGVIVVDRQGPTTPEILTAAQKSGACSIESVLSDGSLLVALRTGHLTGKTLLVIPGVQCVAKEGIEILGLGIASRPTERIAAADQVQYIIAAGGLPCIPWSPGKWLGRRGRVVLALFDIFGPHQIAVGDIAIRSTWGPPSTLLTHARSSGFPVLYGSDPLPAVGEESLVGTLGVVLKGDSASANGVVAGVLNKLRDPLKMDGVIGRRNSPLLALKRFVCSNLRRG